MAEASSFVRVVYNNRDQAVAEIPLDGKVRTYAGLAETAAIKHLGMSLLEAHVPAGALSLRGPVSASSKTEALSILALTDDVELSNLIAVSCGDWFFLTICTAPPPGEF
jgi:hypothetical protein